MSARPGRLGVIPGTSTPGGYAPAISFNARLRDELLDGEIFYSLREAQVVIEDWRRHYNTIRPHSSLGYRPPAPETIVPGDLHRLAGEPTMH